MAAPRNESWPVRVAEVVGAARRLGDRLPGVVAVGLAGSWARGTARSDSDVDIVVLSTKVALALDSTAWFSAFGPRVSLIRCRDFGAIQERRLAIENGPVVEVGIGTPAWANVCPIDAGTRRVVGDGFVILHDPLGILGTLVDAVGSRLLPAGPTAAAPPCEVTTDGRLRRGAAGVAPLGNPAD